jgi:hypothetical protein
MPEVAISTKIHLEIGPRNLWNVPPQTACPSLIINKFVFKIVDILQTKRLYIYNPKPNYWNPSNKHVDIYGDGLCVSAISADYFRSKKFWHVYAEKGFPISVEMCRQDGFPGTIVYYFEATQTARSESW